MPRITCDSCRGRRGYTTGGYNEHWNTCRDCRGTGIDIEATLISLEEEINKLCEENKQLKNHIRGLKMASGRD